MAGPSGVLVGEVAALYTAYVRGEGSPLAELPIQYADFARVAARVAARRSARGSNWTTGAQQLADAPPVLESADRQTAARRCRPIVERSQPVELPAEAVGDSCGS